MRGTASIKFIEYHDTTSCDGVYTSNNTSRCDFYFRLLKVYDSTRCQLVYIGTTISSVVYNTATVNLQDVTE